MNKLWRVTFTKSQLSWTTLHSERVLWTDETNLQVSYRKVIRKRDEANDRSCCNRVFSNPSSVMAWGSTAANGIDNLHFYKDTIKVENYRMVKIKRTVLRGS